MNDFVWQWTASWPLVWMCTHDDSGVVAANGDVLRPGRRREAKDEDEHGHNEQHPRHDDGFPLPLLEGAWKTTKQLRRFPPSQALEEDGGSWVDWSLFASFPLSDYSEDATHWPVSWLFLSRNTFILASQGFFKYMWKSQRSEAQNTNTLVRSKSEKAHVKEITMDSTPACREKKNKAAFLHQKYFLYYFLLQYVVWLNGKTSWHNAKVCLILRFEAISTLTPP